MLRLWHGTSKVDPDVILQSENGLDERMSSTNGFYGQGIYMAEHARYSNGDEDRGYFHADPLSGRRQLLLMLVACGNVKDYGREIHRRLKQVLCSIRAKFIGLDT